MIQINSPWISAQIDPGRGTFSYRPADPRMPDIENARLSVSFKVFGQPHTALLSNWNIDTVQASLVNDPHLGTFDQVRCASLPDASGLVFTLTFALVQEQPLFVWKVEVRNQGDLPVTIQRIELLRTGGQASEGKLILPGDGDNSQLSFFSNGWQSWSYTAAYQPSQSMRLSRLGAFQNPMVYNAGTPRLRQPGYFTSDFFGILADRTHRTAVLAGFLSQQQHFGSIEAILFDQPSLRVWANGDDAVLEPGQPIETDWAVLTPLAIDQPDPLAVYLDAAAAENEVRVPAEIPTGWCSWYYYYTKVTASDIRTNLQQVVNLQNDLPLELVLIDDGFEANIGDWLETKPGFPDGMKPLATDIHAAGLRAGLWLAPFIVHPQSKLANQHPDWLLRGRSGRPVRTGFGWNTFPYALDLTQPAAIDYAGEVIRTAVEDWGYPYLKLDFLYAGALAGQHVDPTVTRAQALRRGMQVIRQAAGDKTFLLGCGLPLGSGLGLVEGMRISADVSGSWRPNYFGMGWLFREEPCMPSARAAIHNSLKRASMHRRWWINDPDCLLVRPDSQLTLPEVQSLTSVIGMTGGSIILSDNLAALPEERIRLAKVLLPPIGKTPQVIDWIDSETPQRLRLDLDSAAGSWSLVAWYNPADAPQAWSFTAAQFRLAEGDYWTRSFWDGIVGDYSSSHTPQSYLIPAHGCAVLAVRMKSDEPIYLGSDLHFSQGLEITAWQTYTQGLQFRIERPGKNSGCVDLALPEPPKQVQAGGDDVAWQEISPGVYRLQVYFEQQIEITIQ